MSEGIDPKLIMAIRADSLSKRPGMTYKYRDHSIETCRQVLVNRRIRENVVQVIFEEHDGYGHGLNVPPDMILEEHVRDATIECSRCNGAGKLVLGGIDCTECNGTGRVPGKIQLT